jgi:hypothetical protein
MKSKLLLGATALVLLSSASAYAGVSLDIGLNPAPVYAAPVYAAPVYAPPPPVYYPGYIAPHPYVVGYDPHHRAHDWRYWHDRHEREHWDHR